jgi:hypothetical protein
VRARRCCHRRRHRQDFASTAPRLRRRAGRHAAPIRSMLDEGESARRASAGRASTRL